MPGPKVVLVAPPAVACRNPAVMEYGGVERVAARLTWTLATLGCEMVPVAAADSDFGPGVTTRRLSSEPAWCTPDRFPTAYSEDVATLLERFGKHVRAAIKAEQADAVLLLGPSEPVLRGALAAERPRSSVIAATLHNGPGDNRDTVPLLDGAPDLVLFCLSEAQRSSFGPLARRLEVVTDGIPVEAVPFAADPAAVRSRLATDPAYRGMLIRPDRPLVGQVDYFHPNKAMLTSLRMFCDSGLWRSHDLLLAGGPGWQLPSRRPAAERSYLAEMREFVARNGLDEHVHILPALPGWQVAELYGAMDLVLSPMRLEDPVAGRDPESYGQGRAIANSAGTPVLMSTAYDRSFHARDDLWCSDAADGAEALRRFTSEPQRRSELRAFAQRRDDMLPALARYAELVGLDPAPGDLRHAVAQLVRAETERRWP